MIEFAIDRGGTFTDLIARVGDRFIVKKVLSNSPFYAESCSHAIAEVIYELYGKKDPIDLSFISSIRMGTTIATNALLERKGVPTALVVTEGFGDLLYIGDQTRPDIFALEIEKPEPLFSSVVEVKERVIVKKGEFIVETPLDEERLRADLLKLNVKHLAVCLLHGYGFFEHEKRIKEIAESMGFSVVCSHETVPLPGAVARAETTLVDAYLTPKLQEYLNLFKAPFKGDVANKTLMMQSDGTLCAMNDFRGTRALLSGPAGGVTALASIYENRPLIGFDMGGTSTDVCRYDGEVALRYESETAGVKVRVPQVDLHTVASGGGSRLFYKNGLFVVGPESSGADPGPLCYGRNGYLSITDANLVTGRLDPESFPKIFGKNGDEPLSVSESRRGFEQVSKEIGKSIEEVAEGFLDVANEQMATAIREVTLKKGFDPADHILCAFGGAGGQHAVAVARKLGIKKVLIHRYAGILSAFGMALAKRSFEKIRHIGLPLVECRDELFDPLKEEIEPKLPKNHEVRWYRLARLYYEGTDTLIEIPFESAKSSFEEKFKREFGFLMSDRQLMVESIRMRAEVVAKGWSRQKIAPISEPIEPIRVHRLYSGGSWLDAPVYDMERLGSGAVIEGPALVMQSTSTIVLEPGCRAELSVYGDLIIDVPTELDSKQTEIQAVMDALFSNRFFFLATRMGDSLRKSAVSTNIKERLDFSCAIFDRFGNLIANAPHIPVHLGSMSSVVKAIKQKFPDPKEGSVYISNAPYEGGSHLPDITVVTPCIENGEVTFWVASRGHHADIGGSVPGSMPPFSHQLFEEGSLFEAFELVENGRFNEKRVREILERAGARRIEDNLSDLRAQVAANSEGIAGVLALMREYGKESIERYMESIQKISETAVRNFFKSSKKELFAKDFLDNGTPIVLKISIDDEGGAVFDFTGSGMEVWGNQNTPPSVVRSAIIYTIRAMLREDLPLNEGLIAPIKLSLPEGSLLNPGRESAVVGGNVTTSQRIVDVVLKAFGESAGSQGCMNNVTFGNEDFGYYETIGGGAGATPKRYGASGVHTHMTNTRITDVEILERRYPVMIETFALRKESGGLGRNRGGDGLIRRYRFFEDLDFAILSERRVFAPFGLAGGSEGQKGRNILIRDKKMYDLGAKVQLKVKKGDKIEIQTPGGGGYGKVDNKGKLCD